MQVESREAGRFGHMRGSQFFDSVPRELMEEYT